MIKPDIPKNESQRLQALCDLNILDTSAEERFDRLTRIVKQHFAVSIALVSLVDSERQWFKSRQGLDADETPRDISFCGHAILSEDILYVPNALEDPRFFDNPLVTNAPNIRFYAGAPLHAPDGHRIGTLCIIDDKPREFSADELSLLRDVADVVEAELERTKLLLASFDATRLGMVAERTDNAVIITDAGGLIEWVNRGFERISGYLFEEVVGKKPGDFLLGDESSEKTKNFMHQKIHDGEAFSTEILNYTKNGNRYWLAISVQPIRDDKNQLTNFIAIESDITTRKKFEAELQALTAMHQGILDSANFSIISTNTEGLIQLFNPGAERMLGYTADEMINKQSPAIIHDPDEVVTRARVLSEELNTSIKPGFGVFIAKAQKDFADEGEWTYIRKDGSRFPVLLSITAIRDSHGEITGYLGIGFDISERKQSEEKIQARENRIRSIVDTVVDGIVTIDKQGLVQTFNPAAENIFGYQSDQIIGQNVKILMPESYAKEHDGYLNNYLTTGERKVIGIGREVTGQRKDSSTFPMELSVSEMEVNGERMFTGIVRDITERKKLDRMKNEFISTVSHELRTPLTSIRGALGLVLGKSAKQLPEKVQVLLEMADRNSERLTLLINDILDLEKIESGSLEFELTPVDLVSLAHRAVEDNAGYASKHDIELNIDVVDLKEALIFGDAHRLLQVFANLISNAVKYSPKNGHVDIRVRDFENGYRVSVIDYGAGISDEFKTRIFQRFAQADSSDTREKGGTGLGLSITRAIVERLQGEIDYVSEIGKGTEFYFNLPKWNKPLKDTKTSTQDSAVLICEDNPDVAMILTEMLKAEDLRCDIAGTGEEVRKLLKERSYRLLLLDLNLPDIDGLKLLSELRNTPATEKLPVIVVSGRAHEGKIEFNGDAVTVIDWIQKPIDPNHLERALKEALNRFERPQILHVEDDPDIVQITKVLLEDVAGFTHVPSVSEARLLLQANEYDLVILDLSLADGSGVELLDQLKGHCPIVIFSAQEPGRDISEQVTTALTKSTTSNEKLLDTIKNILKD